MDRIKLKDIKFFCLEMYPEGSNSHKKYNWGFLKKSISDNGYDPKKYGYISISCDNYCVDGHHRIIVLKEKFGLDFEIDVIKHDKKFFRLFIKNVIRQIFKNEK